jgi:hypothetical protein
MRSSEIPFSFSDYLSSSPYPAYSESCVSPAVLFANASINYFSGIAIYFFVKTPNYLIKDEKR